MGKSPHAERVLRRRRQPDRQPLFLPQQFHRADRLAEFPRRAAPTLPRDPSACLQQSSRRGGHLQHGGHHHQLRSHGLGQPGPDGRRCLFRTRRRQEKRRADHAHLAHLDEFDAVDCPLLDGVFRCVFRPDPGRPAWHHRPDHRPRRHGAQSLRCRDRVRGHRDGDQRRLPALHRRCSAQGLGV